MCPQARVDAHTKILVSIDLWSERDRCDRPSCRRLVSRAEAEVGRPLTPVSVAGAALLFVVASLAAIAVIAVTVWLCFAYADRLQKVLGKGGTDIAVRLSAFILFCIGLQILWSGGNKLLRSLLYPGSVPSLP